MDQDKIIEVLKYIKEQCRNNDCGECPFGSVDRDCNIAKVPCEWNINDPNGETWRALL